MARILVIEDELKIQQIIRAYLEKEGFEVAAAADGMKGLAMIRDWQPDLIILDLMLPGLSGEDLLTELRQTRELPVIILSAKTSEEERIFGLNIGADDYMIKPFSPRELVARVYARLRRLKNETEGTTRLVSFNEGELIIDYGKYQVFRQKEQMNLTPTEFKILELLTRAPGQVFKRSQLVEQVQGYDYDGYDRTIDSHIKNLRHKIEPDPETPKLILTVFGVGYKFGGKRDV